jgi:1-acyl-sn-glycerol-3-phosphate acyltransferase
MESYNYALNLLKDGELIGMFPEATLNEGGKKFLKAKTGAIRLAIEAQVPLIPLSTSGADKIIGKDLKTFSLSQKLVAKFGKPITVHEQYFGKNPSYEQLQDVAAHLMQRIGELVIV